MRENVTASARKQRNLSVLSDPCHEEEAKIPQTRIEKLKAAYS